ncbi:hypothetical protein ACYUAC_001245 [Citrobacter amalonaticus]
MGNEFLNWLGGVAASIGVTGTIGYLCRGSLSRFMTKSVEHRFDKKLEKYKAEIKESEKEVEQMRNYLSSVRYGRDSLLQRKKIESAERLIKARRMLDEFNMVVIYMQMFKLEAFFENMNDPKIQNVIDVIIKPLDLKNKTEEYKKLDRDTPRLYLSDKTMKVFDAYSGIIMLGVSKLIMLETKDENASGFVSSDSTIKQIIELLPHTKESFDKYGDSFIFQLHDYFRRELLTEIKNELTGDNTMARDTELAADLAIGLRNAQVRVKETIEQLNIPDELIKNDAKMV